MLKTHLNLENGKMKISSYNGNSRRRETIHLKTSLEGLTLNQVWNFYRLTFL